MLNRVSSFYEFLEIPQDLEGAVRPIVLRTAKVAAGMTTLEDYHALAAIVLYTQPRTIFEIGTYLGVTSDFFLQLAPQVEVVSIAYAERRLWRFLHKPFNNTLPKESIGSQVAAEHRSRYRQIIGDSHELEARKFVSQHGRFDLVFVDGDHSRDGVEADTRFAQQILSENGTICWHDANPKRRYMAVREFLERDLPLNAAATADTYIGGVACWSRSIEERLKACAAE